MERPEAQDTGSISLTGLNVDSVLICIQIAIENKRDQKIYSVPADYQVSDCSWRVLTQVAGNAGISNRWHGII
jgi:UDP-N-acetyl-L-fucosamine synthase